MPRRKVSARRLAVVLHDLAWLLPRTIGVEAARRDPLPASELEVMRLLARQPGITVNDVAHELGMRPSNVSTAVRALEAKGTLRRRKDVGDKRVVRLEPTETALASREARELSWGLAMNRGLAALTPEDRDAVAAAVGPLERLAAVLAGSPSNVGVPPSAPSTA